MKLVVIIALLVAAHPAHAQECHHAPRSTSPLAVRAGLAMEAAAIDDGLGRSGTYRGAVTSVEVAALGGRARIAIGAYQVDWGQTGAGLGDLQLGVERAVIRAGATQLGLALSATLPTGDVADELGMGHSMVMPAAWARLTGERSSLTATVVYGTMFGHHHAHGMAGPLPSPMNAQELSASLRGGHHVGRTELSTTVFGAAPLGDGTMRAALGAGARWLVGATELGIDVSAPFGGTPIQARGVFEISRGF